MKKEIVTGALLLSLIAFSFFNIHWLDGFIGELSQKAECAHVCIEAGDFENAEICLREAIDKWNAADGYTHIFIRHSEIDCTSDIFYDLLGDIKAEDTDSAAGSYEKLIYHFKSIVGMERPSLGSIF